MADPTSDAVAGGTIAGASLGVVAAVGLGVGAGPFIGMGVVGAGLGGAIGLGAAALDYRAPNPTGQAGFPCMFNHTHVRADHHRRWKCDLGLCKFEPSQSQGLAVLHDWNGSQSEATRTDCPLWIML